MPSGRIPLFPSSTKASIDLVPSIVVVWIQSDPVGGMATTPYLLGGTFLIVIKPLSSVRHIPPVQGTTSPSASYSEQIGFPSPSVVTSPSRSFKTILK